MPDEGEMLTKLDPDHRATAASRRDGPPLNLHCCLLSGGASRRMGTDKALLAHPDGATWLERSLLLLAELGAPITLLSRWPEHLDLARHLAVPQLEPLLEPAPHEGPLLALQRLMEHQPNHQLLLCPVDMPGLSREAIGALLHRAKADPGTIHLAHDGQHLQPLLGVYPSDADRRNSLTAAVTQGERRLQRWLSNETWRRVSLDPQAIRNVNCAEEWSSSPRSDARC